MKNINFLAICLSLLQSCLSQKKMIEREECKGVYYLHSEYDHKNPDSVRIIVSIQAIQRNEVFKSPNSYVLINGKTYKSNREGNFEFKIKPGIYSVYARDPHTYGLTTKKINFATGTLYVFNFCLLAQVIVD